MGSFNVNLKGRGIRGESYADIARRSGLFGILPTDDDETVISKINADAEAIADRAELAAEQAELAAEQAADLVLPENRFVAADLATARSDGEAGTVDGTYFIAVGEAEGEAEVRLRTAGGSDLIYTEITKTALASTDPGKGAWFVGYIADGVGAMARRVMDKLRERPSILDYGAVAYATREAALAGTSSTAAIHAALAAHDDVIVPKGWYKVEGITIPSNKRLRGSFFGTSALVLADNIDTHVVKTENAGFFVPTVRNKNIQVWDLTIDGNRDNQANEGQWSGVEISWTDHFEVRRCKCINTRGHGVSVHGSRYGVVSDGESYNFGDDGVSVADASLDYSDPNMVYSENVLVENWHSHDSNHQQSYTQSGSGFEVDDGPRHITFRNCVAERCILGFEIHWHNTPAAELEDLQRAPGYISWERCRSVDPTKGHYSAISHNRIELTGLRVIGCVAEGTPPTPNSTSGALDVSNGVWNDVKIENFVAKNAGRINLRGIRRGEISFTFDGPNARVDIGGQTLPRTGTDGTPLPVLETYTEDVVVTRAHIVNANAVLFTRMRNVHFGALTAEGVPFVQFREYDDVTVDRLVIRNATDAARALFIGAAGAENSIGLKVLSGEITDSAGSGVGVYPSATGEVRDTVLNLNIRRSNGAGLRLATGFGGWIDGFRWSGVIEDSCLDHVSITSQVNIGSDSGSHVRNVWLNGDINNAAGFANWGVSIIQVEPNIYNIFYEGGNIAGAGTIGNIHDPARIMKVLPGVIGGHVFAVTSPAGGVTVDAESRAAINKIKELLEGRGLL